MPKSPLPASTRIPLSTRQKNRHIKTAATKTRQMFSGGRGGSSKHSSRKRGRNDNSGGGGTVRVARRVYVGNLSWQTTWQSLKDFFNAHGRVVYCDVMKEADGRRSKGCGESQHCSIARNYRSGGGGGGAHVSNHHHFLASKRKLFNLWVSSSVFLHNFFGGRLLSWSGAQSYASLRSDSQSKIFETDD